MIKDINKYNIPIVYKEIISNFYNRIQNVLNDKLLLFMMTGSCGREAVSEGWSDIDILIVIKEYRFDSIRKINECLNDFEIKIGTTIYSQKEFEDIQIDGKTLFSIYLLQNSKLSLTYINDSLKIPSVNIEMVRNNDIRVKVDVLHKLKRLLYKGEDKVSIIKSITLIMKIELMKNDIMPENYQQIFDDFANIYNIDSFNIKSELNDKKISDSFKSYIINLVEMICNN